MIAALIEGADLDAIAALERLSAEEAQMILREGLKAVDMFAAIDRAVKVVDRLDRYHGFHRASPAIEGYGDDEREKLLDKLNAVAARLIDEPSDGGCAR